MTSKLPSRQKGYNTQRCGIEANIAFQKILVEAPSHEGSNQYGGLVGQRDQSSDIERKSNLININAATHTMKPPGIIDFRKSMPTNAENKVCNFKLFAKIR